MQLADVLSRREPELMPRQPSAVLRARQIRDADSKTPGASRAFRFGGGAESDSLDLTPSHSHQTRRSTISFLSSAMALAGFRPFGQALAQFRMVWQR